jgi:hypothetical protein
VALQGMIASAMAKIGVVSTQDDARRAGVERPAIAVQRGDATGLVKVAGALRSLHRGATGDRAVALIPEQALTGEVNATSDVE